ncbi:selenocysteine-specific translation elongation factor [bacterium]|nr:selenocysteine-specific translation elongation factor [bacterium]
MSHIIVGTAGHIDHGKSSLVLALTGTDPDRLPEERKRKITIDLGYAFLNDDVAIIDVPGHEKFIRNMVAGASTVDYAILVIAADDGVMPQTTEHLQILKLLGVRDGCVVITKIDIADNDWIDLVEEQIEESVKGTFLQGAELFRIDSLSKRGLPEFREFLLSALSSMTPRNNPGVFRLPIDRVFSLKGHGTVVTGTVLSGTVGKDDKLVILPGSHSVRVKHVESHGKERDSLVPGQRAALNLIGEVKDLERGLTLGEPDSLFETSRIRIAIELIPNSKPLKDRQRLRFLIGTDEALGRLQILHQAENLCFANLLLEKPVVAAWGDRFIIRRYSPMETLGGGKVLEAHPPKLRAADKAAETDFSRQLSVNSIAEALFAQLKTRGRFGIAKKYLAQCFGIPVFRLHELLEQPLLCEAVQLGDFTILKEHIETCKRNILSEIDRVHETQPELKGLSISAFSTSSLKPYAEQILQRAVDELIRSNLIGKQSGVLFRLDRKPSLTDHQQALINSISAILKRERFTPPLSGPLAEELSIPKQEVEKTLVIMERLEYAKRIGLDFFFDSDCFTTAVRSLRGALANSEGLSVSEISSLLSSSRKYVVPFLEYLDSEGVTRRENNLRVKGPKF